MGKGTSMGDKTRRLEPVEEKLLHLLGEEITVSEEILFFAESTCGLDPEELESALKDPRFEEREALLALIFTPDMGVRTALEPLLPAEPAYTSTEIDVLVDNLAHQIDALHLLLADKIRFALPVESDDLGYYVAKLYLDRSISQEIIEALTQCFSPETVVACRLVIRFRGNTHSVEETDFLRHFITKSRAYEEIFAELFSLVLLLLAERGEAESIADYFLSRRRQLIRTLREIREFEQKRDHYSMEYLMMQRYRVPHESEEHTLGQLQMLTIVTDAILGLPPDPSLQADFRNLGTYGRGTDLSDIIRVLS